MWARVNAMLGSRGITMAELREQGIITLERSTPEETLTRIPHEDQCLDCFPEQFADGRKRMADIFDELRQEPPHQLKLISKRDGYMLNSWYSNVKKLRGPRRQTNPLYMHPEDAEMRQIADGDTVQIHNKFGNLQATVKLTDELHTGVVAMTHGWGHQQSNGMQTAQAYPGVNCNVLLPSGADSFEPLSNQAHMTGVPVEVQKT